MIEIKNLSKKFGDTKVLDDISFSVKKGEILGFLGPNGAGKSTTMKIITDFWAPTSGSVEVDGIVVRENSIETRKKIGYLPETVPLYEDMLVIEYLKFVAEVRGISKKNIKNRIKEVVESCKLREVLRKPIDELSKGYRQRVGIAQAIMHEPDILILDEPTTGLDPKQIIEIRNLIKEIGKEKTVIFSTHILSEVSATCDRVVIINKGKIVSEGTPAEILERTEAKKKKSIVVEISGDEKSVLDEIRNIRGVESARVNDEITLEDAFLELTK
ncbi:ATP-binding cassette domain-containing protein [Candidatus Parcubacteria bacterium]|nr:ATP-binding cassette domain-containing protein [Candidatus Parcubacteria bacterium]